jgi:acetyl-CoA carboxylase biotin carboxyl carrier protein
MAVIELKSELTGTVWRLVASKGQVLQEDDTLLIIESMKMEIPICAPEDCRLIEIIVLESQLVKEGDVIARLDVD